MSSLYDFFKEFPLITYGKRHTILNSGDVPQGVYFLESGYVRLYSVTGEGKEFTLLIYKPNDIFPFVWAFQGQPAYYYFETVTDVSLRKIPRSDFLYFVQSHAEELLELTSNIVSRLDGVIHRMEHVVLGRAYTKVASLLFILSNEYGHMEGGAFTIAFPLTHKEVAALVGLTREATSLQLEKLEREGIISRKKHFIVIRDRKKLMEVSSLG